MIFAISQRSRKEQMRGNTALHPLEPYTNPGEVVLTRVPVWDVPGPSSPHDSDQKLPEAAFFKAALWFRQKFHNSQL